MSERNDRGERPDERRPVRRVSPVGERLELRPVKVTPEEAKEIARRIRAFLASNQRYEEQP